MPPSERTSGRAIEIEGVRVWCVYPDPEDDPGEPMVVFARADREILLFPLYYQESNQGRPIRHWKQAKKRLLRPPPVPRLRRDPVLVTLEGSIYGPRREQRVRAVTPDTLRHALRWLVGLEGENGIDAKYAELVIGGGDVPA